MPYPSQIFSQIRARKARPSPGTRAATPPPVAPAPAAQTHVPDPSQQTATPQQAAPVPPPAPESPTPRRPAGHALYSQVMRKHDRAGRR